MMASMQETKIRKMKLLNAKPNEAGNLIVAIFDLEHAGIVIEGCKLFERAAGDMVAHGPRGKAFGQKIRADFVDEALATAVTDRARTVYLALTGRTDSHA